MHRRFVKSDFDIAPDQNDCNYVQLITELDSPLDNVIHASDSLANQVGDDSHFNYANTPYTTVPNVLALMQSSGIRHVRDSGYPQGHNVIATPVSSTETATQLDAIKTANPNADYVELCGNEYDHSGDPNWLAAERGCIADQLPIVSEWGLPVALPSSADDRDMQGLGYFPNDYANEHFYSQCSYNPGTKNREQMSTAVSYTQMAAPHCYVTEMGYPS